MRTYTQDVEIDINAILEDVAHDLPTPACPVFCGTVDVTVSGKDTPARIFCRNEDAQPAEYREAESDLLPCELAWQVWRAYAPQVGPLSLPDRNNFLFVAEGYCRTAIEEAEGKALEEDNEPPDYDDTREEKYAI